MISMMINSVKKRWTGCNRGNECYDYITDNIYCDNIPYPRICRYTLDTFSMNDFIFSLGLDNDNEELYYQICYGDGDVYFGVGFGSIGMMGDAAIYTTGKDNDDTIDIYDYNLTGQSDSGVTSWALELCMGCFYLHFLL